MGSSGSKSKPGPKKDEKNKVQTKQRNERKKSVPKAKVQEDSPRRDPPKGVRRPSDPTTRKSEQHMEYEPIVPYEAENLNLEGNWEVEKGIDVSTFLTSC